MKDRAEEAAQKLRDINEADYKVVHVETDLTIETVVFYIFVDLKESGKRGYITMNVSNMAVRNPSFQLYDFLLERLRKGVDMLIKKLSW